MKKVVAALMVLGLVGPVGAQQIIPNPLINPKQGGASNGQPGAPNQAPSPNSPVRSYPPAPGGGGQNVAPNSSNMGNVNSAPELQDGSSIPREVENRFNNIYVSSIVGSSAVLRVPVQAPGQMAGGQMIGGSQMMGGYAAPIAPLGMQSPGTPGAPAAQAVRSISYTVKDGVPFPFRGEHVLYPRVEEKRVLLYLMPEGENVEKIAVKKPIRMKLVFQGSVDALSSPAYVPAKEVRELPDSNYRNAVQPVTANGTSAYGGSSLSGGNGSNPVPNGNVGAMR